MYTAAFTTKEVLKGTKEDVLRFSRQEETEGILRIPQPNAFSMYYIPVHRVDGVVLLTTSERRENWKRANPPLHSATLSGINIACRKMLISKSVFVLKATKGTIGFHCNTEHVKLERLCSPCL